MQTLKTAFVVVLLLTVLYGAHEVLNQPDARPPRDAADAARLPPELQLDEGTLDTAEVVDLSQGSAPSNRMAEISDDARPLVPPPSAPPKFGESTEGQLAAGGSSLDRPPTTPAAGIPELSPFPNEALASVGEVEAGAATAPPPPSNDPSFATAPFPQRPAADSGPSASAFVPPPATPPSNREAVSAAPTAFGASPSPFAAPTVSAGAFAGLPDPKAVAQSINSEVSRTSAGVEGAVDQVAQSGQDSVAKAKDLADGVRFDPKEALLSRGWRAAQDSLKANNWRQALATLSSMYEDPRLTHQERQRLLDSLDPLAARVIYSTEHLLEPAHEVRRGDNLMQLGEKYNVPWQLLRNINGIADPEFLVPGTKLKMIRGPFRAEIDTGAQEMTIYLQRLYAGRFPLGVGNEPAPRQGDFEVQRKEPGRQFYASNGVVLPAGDVKNPYGRCWLDLGSDVSIHGSALEAGGPVSSGCIGLSPRDADDVFAILSVGSRVSIR